MTVPERTAFQMDILWIIRGSDDEIYGIAIKEHLESKYGQAVNHGRLYPNLDELAEAGLVEKGTIDDRTNSYELTEEAIDLLDSRHEWESEQIEAGQTEEDQDVPTSV